MCITLLYLCAYISYESMHMVNIVRKSQEIAKPTWHNFLEIIVY